jgi:hypothetical protein
MYQFLKHRQKLPKIAYEMGSWWHSTSPNQEWLTPAIEIFLFFRATRARSVRTHRRGATVIDRALLFISPHARRTTDALPYNAAAPRVVSARRRSAPVIGASIIDAPAGGQMPRNAASHSRPIDPAAAARTRTRAETALGIHSLYRGPCTKRKPSNVVPWNDGPARARRRRDAARKKFLTATPSGGA